MYDLGVNGGVAVKAVEGGTKKGWRSGAHLPHTLPGEDWDRVLEQESVPRLREDGS